MKNIRLTYQTSAGQPRGGWLSRTLAIIVGILVFGLILAVGLAFSIVVIPIVLLAVLIGGGMLWFKTRTIRREFREQVDAFKQSMPGSRDGDAPQPGRVIDGDDYIRDADESSQTTDRVTRH